MIGKTNETQEQRPPVVTEENTQPASENSQEPALVQKEKSMMTSITENVHIYNIIISVIGTLIASIIIWGFRFTFDLGYKYGIVTERERQQTQ